MRFPDGETKPLGGLALAREWRRSSLGIEIDRRELPYTISSLRAHPYETAAALTWKRTTDAAESAAALHATRYFDGNSGRGADAYQIVRVAHSANASLSIGSAFSYRDTDDTRFRLIGASAVPSPGGGFSYSYTARYDPYWTPRNLREVRGIVAATYGLGRAALHLHADAGLAHDRDLVFGPTTGATATVPLFAAPIEVSRTFHPWRASADLSFPLRGAFAASAGVEHQRTAFYRANSVHFGFSGRL
jgi:hypothetical protein